MTFPTFITAMVARSFKTCPWVVFLAAAVARAAEPIPLVLPEATFHSGASGSLGTVVDGVETGPQGWSVEPKISEPQALVVRCARPVEAAELDFELFFLAGRPFSTIAEFSLSFTTDEVPSLHGNWKPLDVQRFSAEVSTLRRTDDGRLRSDPIPYARTGKSGTMSIGSRFSCPAGGPPDSGWRPFLSALILPNPPICHGMNPGILRSRSSAFPGTSGRPPTSRCTGR